MGRYKLKVITSLQPLISHQMRPYSSFNALLGWSYTCFTGTQVEGNLEKLGLDTPDHVHGHIKFNSKSSALSFTSNETYSSVKVLCRLGYPCWEGSRYWESLVKLASNTLNHVQGHIERNPKCSAPYFTSSETLLKCPDPLWVELYLFHRYSCIGAF